MRGSSTSGLGLRVARAVPFATVCVVVSALGHSLAGGGTPSVRGLVVGGLVVLAAAMVLGGRERSLPVIVGGLAVGEVGLHLWFHHLHQSMSEAVDGMAGTAGMAGMGGAGLSPLDLMASKLLCGPLPAGLTSADIVRFAGLDPAAYSDAVPLEPAAALGITPVMALGHLAAALVTGWWLRRGEVACRRLLGLALVPLRLALALLFAWLPGPACPSVRLPRRYERDWRLPAAAVLGDQLVRRGPPLPLAA